MSWLEFIATMTQALVWPVAAVCIAIVLRKPLTKLLGKLRSLGFGDTKMEFGDQLIGAEVLAGTLSDGHSTPAPVVVADDAEAPVAGGDIYAVESFQSSAYQSFENIAVVSPPAAVLSIWSHIYKLLNELADVHGVKARNAKSVIQQLHLKNVLSGLTVALLEDLRVMRNIAAHPGESSSEITLADAIRYRDIAQTVEPGLRRLVKNPGGSPV